MRLEGKIAPCGSIDDLAQAVNEKLSALYGKLIKVPRSVLVVAVSAGVAKDPFTVAHTLGVIPSMVCGTPWGDGYCFATEADRKAWTESSVRLRCSAVTTKVDVEVISYK